MGIEDNWRGVCLEGVSYVGKSSAIELLRRTLPESDLIVVPEYAEIGNLPPFPPTGRSDSIKAISVIIDLERKRTDLVNDSLARYGDIPVVFDRGPASCIAFQYTMSINGFLGDPVVMAEAFMKQVSDGNIILPFGHIHLTCSMEEIKLREARTLASGHRPIMEFLRRVDVIGSFTWVFERYKKYLPDNLTLSLNSQDKSLAEITSRVWNFIQTQPSRIDETPDLIKFATDLKTHS